MNFKLPMSLSELPAYDIIADDIMLKRVEIASLPVDILSDNQNRIRLDAFISVLLNIRKVFHKHPEAENHVLFLDIFNLDEIFIDRELTVEEKSEILKTKIADGKNTLFLLEKSVSAWEEKLREL